MIQLSIIRVFSSSLSWVTPHLRQAEHDNRHTGGNWYPYAHCEKRFYMMPAFVFIWIIIRYKCTECGKHCHSCQHLATHRQSHSGEKPFECTVCGKRFTVSVNLVTHSRLHSGEKPYKCHVCDKVWTSKQSHESRHGRQTIQVFTL